MEMNQLPFFLFAAIAVLAGSGTNPVQPHDG